MSLEKTIKNRRTIRSFDKASLTLEHFSQLLWAAQGVTDDHGFKRAAASGGALFPLDLYSVVGEEGVATLNPGLYHYEPETHAVAFLTEGDIRVNLAREALGQMWMAAAPLNLVITAEYRRICGKYGERGVRYAILEAGHAAQNIFLQAEALGLGAGIVGAFNDEGVVRILEIPKSHEPLLVMAVGYSV
jgi:SagB-type dehydrogenase family enzyme